MLKTQKLFKELGHVDAVKYLSETLFITCKECDDFYVLNYNQIFSPEDDDYVMECRSLQLDKQGNVVSRAYPRFFNYGQRPEITGKFVFEGCRILEKVDGSLIRVYWNPFGNRWEIATRGTAFAESEQDFYPSFRQAVLEDGFGVTEEEFQDVFNREFNKDHTFVFEYCSIKNRIVTLYAEPVMYFVVAIENYSGEEVHGDDEFLYRINTLSHNVKIVEEYTFNDNNDMLKGLEELPDLKEGFVAQDVNGLRVKFKNSLYLKLHKMRGDNGFTEKKIASLVADNEYDEVFVYFPEYKELFQPYIRVCNELFSLITMTYSFNAGLESQKDFALAVKDYTFSGILFTMRKTGKSFEDVWSETRLESRIELILNAMKVERAYEAGWLDGQI